MRKYSIFFMMGLFWTLFLVPVACSTSTGNEPTVGNESVAEKAQEQALEKARGASPAKRTTAASWIGSFCRTGVAADVEFPDTFSSSLTITPTSFSDRIPGFDGSLTYVASIAGKSRT